MTDLRIWSTLTPAEREQAIAQARIILDGGEKRWHTIARLCGLDNSNGLRRAMDPAWRGKRNEIDRQRMEASRRGLAAAMMHTPGNAPITLPKLKFMEETTSA